MVSAVFVLGAYSACADSGSTTNQPPGTNSLDGTWHTIAVTPRTDLPKIHFYDKLNPVWWLKNRDDSVPPDWYRPDDKHRKLKWSFRNPFHNFNFYVIGVADRKFYRSGKYPNKISNPNGGWDFEATRRRIIWLPFISYHRPKFDFYLGWRDRGNFGAKININPAKKPDRNKDTPSPENKASTPDESDD